MIRDLETALLRELLRAWRGHNSRLFRGAMLPPVFEHVDTERFYGQWDRRSRTIRMARSFTMGRPWGEVIEVLKHEMAHQYAHEVLGATDETAHGPAFRQTCERLGIDASASGLPEARDTTEDKLVRRIQKLLALAQSPERAEAEAAMAAAQRLMLEHNLHHTPSRYTWRHLGEPTARLPAHVKILGGILLAHFFVEAIWIQVWIAREGRHGKVLEIVGAPENVEMAAYVWDFLLGTAERLWVSHKLQHGIRGDTDRRRFLTGVMAGFSARQRLDKQKHQELGLVWVGDPGLDRFFDARHPARVSGRRTTIDADSSYHAGLAQGHNIVLHKPVAGSTHSRGRLIEG